MSNADILCSDNPFARWAFGEQLWNEFVDGRHEMMDLFNAWHRRHSDIATFDPDEQITETLGKMKAYWEKHGAPK